MVEVIARVDEDGYARIESIPTLTIHYNQPLKVSYRCRCGTRGFPSKQSMMMHRNTDCTYWSFVRRAGYRFKEE